MSKKKYDFSGYVTKNDIRCSDGAVIKQNAFAGSHGKKVPLVWNHNYNTPNNVLGHVVLEQRSDGTYGFGSFNNSENAVSAKEMLNHGDIVSMSIGARKIKRSGANVIHGDIYEVSLVLAGANPGAIVDSVITHGDDGDNEEGYIYTDTLLHVEPEAVEEVEEVEPEPEQKEPIPEEDLMEPNKTLDELLDEMNDEQLQALDLLLDEMYGEEEDDEFDDEEGDDVKHNIWAGANTNDKPVVTKQQQNELLHSAISGKVDSFKDYITMALEDTITHAYDESTQVGGVDFGITNIEFLFPEVHNLNATPKFVMDPNTNFKAIIGGVSKSAFSKVRTRYFDIDINDLNQRARGYTKGTRKLEEVIKMLRRETHPTTIYKKQKLDRDDIIEITDFDVVGALNTEMRTLFEIETARAILVGDGRESTAEDKIPEDKIRPILTDDPIYSIKSEYTDAASFIEATLKAMVEYEGSGKPTMFIDTELLTDIQLLKGTDGRYLNGHIMTDEELSKVLKVSNIVETSFLKGTGRAIIVNLADYVVGSTKGGQLTSFNDFDIDFNRYKYLIEARLSGALSMPKSALVMHKAADASIFTIEAGATEQGRKTEPEEPVEG